MEISRPANYHRLLSEESTVSADSEFSLEYYQNYIYEQLPSAQRRLQGKDQEKEDAVHWNCNQQLKMLPLCIQEKRTIRDRQHLERHRIGYWASWKRSQETARRRLREEVERVISGLLLWKTTLHNIEGRFGVGVKAYFVFLRYLLLLNFLNCAIIAVSVLSPNLYRRTANTTWSKIFQENVSVVNIFLGSGFMEHTPVFYGFYTNRSLGSECLNTALLFFFAMLIILLLNLIMIVRRTVVGYKNTWLTGITFTANMSYKVFCGWDFCIREPDAALLKHNLIRNELKSECKTPGILGGKSILRNTALLVNTGQYTVEASGAGKGVRYTGNPSAQYKHKTQEQTKHTKRQSKRRVEYNRKVVPVSSPYNAWQC